MTKFMHIALVIFLTVFLSHAFALSFSAIADQNVDENHLLVFNVTVSDTNVGQPHLSAPVLPSGAIFNDNNDGTGNFSWIPDFNQAGNYNATFNAMDDNGDANQTVKITVNDIAPPLIVVLGSNPASVTQGTTYNDAGATATDNIDGNVTANIVVTNTVDTAVIGAYTVSYDVNDAAHNTAHATRDVNVVNPVNPPVMIDLNALVNGSSVLLNFSASDANGPGINHYEVSRDENTWVTTNDTNYTYTNLANGVYTFYARAVDNAGNNSPGLNVTVDLNGTDTTPPVTTISGLSPGWHKTGTVLMLTCDDGNGSGCASTSFSTQPGYDAGISGLTHLWTFDQILPGDVIQDSIGTANGTSRYYAEAVPGNTGNAMLFESGNNPKDTNHIGADVNLGPDNGMLGTGNFTVCTWMSLRNIQPNLPTNNPDLNVNGMTDRLISNGVFVFYVTGNTDGSGPYQLNETNNDPDGNHYATGSAHDILLNTWQHVCLTRAANGTANFYIDGKLSGPADQMGGGTPSPIPNMRNNPNMYVHIGNQENFDLNKYFDGNLDDFRIYNRVLAPLEINTIYNAGKGWTNGNSISLNLDGNNRIDYFSTDNNGNTEAINTSYYAIDTTPPTSYISLTDLNLSSKRIQITCVDAGSGCQTTFYTVDGGAQQKGAPPIDFNGSFTTGHHVVSYFSQDLVDNNETPKIFSFDINVVNPVNPPVLVDLNSTVDGSNVLLTFAATDVNGPGINHYEVSQDRSTWITTTDTNYTFNNLPNGTYIFYARAADNNGLYSADKNVSATVSVTTTQSSPPSGGGPSSVTIPVPKAADTNTIDQNKPVPPKVTHPNTVLGQSNNDQNRQLPVSVKSEIVPASTVNGTTSLFGLMGSSPAAIAGLIAVVLIIIGAGLLITRKMDKVQ